MEYTLNEIRQAVGGELIGNGELPIRGVSPFDQAGPDKMTFAAAGKYLKKIHRTEAGAVIVPETFKDAVSCAVIKHRNPQLAFARAVNLFHPLPAIRAGIHPEAHVGEDVVFGKDVRIDPFAVIGDHVVIGNRVWIYPHVVIGDNVVIGDDVTIYPNTTILERCRIGSRVAIHSGTVIGSDGFGFAPDGEKYYKIQQLGIVRIDDDVEIGAGNTIDRATFGETVIGRGVKTDNLVHVAHNVTVEENAILVAQVGIAGSTKIGKHAILAGQVGVSGHLTIGNNVIIGPQSGIGKSIPDGEVVSSGLPTMPHKLWLRVQQIIPKLPEIRKKIKELEDKINQIVESKAN